MSIKQKLVIAVAASMLLLAAITAALVGVASERTVRHAAEQAVASAGTGLLAMEQADVQKLDATLRVLSAHPGLVEAFRARDRERFLALATPIFRDLERKHGITHFYVHAPDRTNFVRVHKPEIYGDRIERATLVASAASGGQGAGKEVGATAFALRVVEPWRVDGEVIGYLELGEEVGHYLAGLKRRTGDDFAMLISKRTPDGKALLGRDAWKAMRERQGLPDDWDAHPDHVVADDTAAVRQPHADVRLGSLRPTGQLLGETPRGDRTYARGVVPITDAAGRQVGGVVVLHDISALHDGMERARAGILLTLAAVAVLMTLLLLALVQRLVFERLASMTATLEDLGARLAGGEYDVGALGPSGPRDEIGRFEAFFSDFLKVVGGLLKELTARR